jgi:hypothetical protein
MTERERPFLRPAAAVVARRVDDQLVLVHLTTHQMYSLNRTGARLWELAERGQSREEALASLASEYAVSEAQVAAEADALVSALIDAKLIEPAG